MYTGIVQALLPVATIDKRDGLSRFSINFPDHLLEALETGASVAVNGVCFTVTDIVDSMVYFDAIKETLELTNIDTIEVGSEVNIERSALADAEIGGHRLSGHIIDTAKLIDIADSENNKRLTFEGDAAWLKYVFNKGFLAVNGASLTVAALDMAQCTFAVNLIPETLKRTNFSQLAVGDQVNIEVESQTQVIVDTVERVLAERY